ncbi:FtsB family cell division protein [Clostridium cylindrosporum]|uniref:Septum formation initiator n=1 Tax=Clostridium cylindrosporum DSM 605 TaxID=1121307 RepID=A0A0J8DCR5_CLOCY|nr:septum formation initiator family protein [Clostridium cylindrosporum]KMT22044.1 septum formation initiator [Clostridium cylindrosporum DSM 605]
MKKRKKKGFKLFWLVVIIFFGVLLTKQQSIINRLSNDYESYEKQKQNLKVQNQQLKERLAKSKSEDYSEILAREKLGMIKEGEILFIDQNKAK